MLQTNAAGASLFSQTGNAMRFCAAVVTISMFAVSIASAAEVGVSSAIETVTVYPDGATVTRVITTDLPAGDSSLVARDFPTSLDPASLRIEGEGSARLVIGAIDARPPRPEPPAMLPDLDRQIEALRDERGTLDDKIAAGDRPPQVRGALCRECTGWTW